MAEWISDHWAATDANWDGDAPRLQWHATLRPRAPALTSLVEQLRPHFERTDLEPVDERWLHLTVHDVGPWPHGRRGELQHLLEAASAQCRAFRPIRLRLGPIRLMKTAVVLEASPAEPIWQLRTLLRAADVHVRGDRAISVPDGPAVRPHVSVAYARRPTDVDELVAAVAALGPHEVDVEISDVELLLLQRDYTWETIASVELFAAAASVDRLSGGRAGRVGR